MVRYAGRVVLVSGSTLAITFVGLVAFPIAFLRSIGVGAAVALACTILVNLSFTPAILLTFGFFFSVFSWPKWVLRLRDRFLDRCCTGKRGQRCLTCLGVRAAPRTELEKQERSFWFRAGRFSTTTKWSIVIIIVVSAVLVPIAAQVAFLKTTPDNTQLFPRDSPALAVYRQMEIDFSPGRLDPYYVIMTTGVPGGVWSDAFYAASAGLCADLVSSGLITDPKDISAITNVGGVVVDFSDAQLAFSSFADTVPKAIMYRELFQSLVNPSNSSAQITLAPSFDPIGSDSGTWVPQARNLLAKHATTGYGFYLSGGNVDSVDATARIYELFPYVIATTIGLVFIIVGIQFRSLFTPLRLIATIALPMCFIYGLGVLVFDKGAFNWAAPMLRGTNGIYWLAPVMSFSILVGLGLDYDIFLVSRIAEYRKAGFTDRASIMKGLYRTGSIITAAGLIMAVAFGGMLLSQELVLNEFGFFLCFAVLVDTFIVRTTLVPAIIHLAGRFNWWPGRQPTPTKDENSFDEIVEGDLEEEKEPLLLPSTASTVSVDGLRHPLQTLDGSASKPLYGTINSVP